MDKDYQHRCVCLDFKFWECSANGPHLKHYIYEVLDEWDLSDLLDDVTSDAGSNIRNALEGFDWNRCVAHNINNAMDVALGARFHIRGENQVSTNPVADDFLKRARGLVAYFKRSGDRTERLSGVQLEMFEKVWKVLQDHHIRWNSTADMLDRLWKLKPAIQLYFATHDPESEAQFSVQEWHICVSVLMFVVHHVKPPSPVRK